MKSKNLITILIALFIVLGVAHFFASLEKTRNDAASKAGGINGVVTAGPVCPVQRAGDASCGDKPVRANIIVKNKKDDVVKNIESREDGSFSVRLSPGNYIIYNDINGRGLMGAKPEFVTVEDGKSAEVTIRIDTGIR